MILTALAPAACSRNIGPVVRSPLGLTTTTTTTNTMAPASGGASALALLAHVAIKGRAPKTGYNRAAFGPAWADTDRNGCDTRNDILRRDLNGAVVRPGTHGCVVIAGTLDDPYSGSAIAFEKARASLVQIDHVVALSDAWQTGAQSWDAARRLVFANDPVNLVAVSGRLNQQKGDADAASWLPPNRTIRCAYVARQVTVKDRFGLWVTPAEHDAIARLLARCPGQPAAQPGRLTP